MEKKLYVGGIAYASTEESLTAAFSKAGNVVSVRIITDKMTGRSKGFGFVEMSTEEEAQNAIKMFDGQEVEGRRIKVNEAKPMR
ncbi:MAG: RNA-binding protein [Patescibacteria group bacterium]|nr:RNA-binding protein [Patescibacteria group bacterium]MDD4304385.1 RNA-binding protein [Patescibacteria group bacterium]MDD4695408.1 RNA-binding protein [Patescibacteria group bacterium]